MKKERTWKFNIVDVVVILVILAAGIFFAFKFLQARPKSNANMITLRYEVEVPGMTRDLYEEIVSFLPCQMAASGEWVDGNILSATWEPCEVTYVEISSPVNSNETQWAKADPNVEYVTGVFQCEARVLATDLLNKVGTQEVRVGRNHYLKGQDIEIIGTIRKMTKEAA